MKRFAAALALLVLVSVPLAVTAHASRTATTAICHRTASKTKPYVKLRVNAKALKTFSKNAADIIPARGACPRSVMTPTAGGTALPSFMTGEAETPAGDPVATGTATIRLRAGQGQVCYQVAARDLPAAAAM